MKKQVIGIALGLLCAAASVFGQPFTGRSPGLDGHFVGLTAELPGFGGYYFDAQGDLNVYLTDTSREAAARAKLADVARTRGERRNNPWTRPAEIIVRHGEFDFAQLDTWNRRLSAALGGSGVTVIDSDEVANKVFVGIAEESKRGAVLALIAAAGVPREAVVVDVVPPVQRLTTLRDYVRPLVGGLEIDFAQSGCTLGVNVWYGNSTVGIPTGTPGFYTASHCSTTYGGPDHTAYTQGGSAIGSEGFDPSFFDYFTYTGCPLTYRCRWSDVLFAAYNAGVSRSQGVVATTTVRGSGLGNSGSIIINGQLSYNSTLPYPTVGIYLDKVGRTSGWTNGRVSATCVNVFDEYSKIGILCQDQVDSYAAPGDSGSPVFQWTFYNTSFAGILWGKTDNGGFYYSNVNRIAQEMGTNVTYTP
jgi:hypothetical protein